MKWVAKVMKGCCSGFEMVLQGVKRVLSGGCGVEEGSKGGRRGVDGGLRRVEGMCAGVFKGSFKGVEGG